MTEAHSQPSQRKRLLLFSLLIVVIIAAVSIGYFLFTFDLNDYRKNAQERLSSLLKLPVTLGNIRYNLQDTNLALDIDGLQLGDDSSDLQVEAKQVVVYLHWLDLLEREFNFAKIRLVEPKILIKQTRGTTPGDSERSLQASPGFKPELLGIFSITALDVIDGSLVIESTNAGQPMQQFEYRELNAWITDFRLNESFQFGIKGQLKLPSQENTSLCQVQGTGGLLFDESQNLEPYFNVDLNVKNLDLASAREDFARQADSNIVKGTTDLDLHLATGPNEEIDFRINLSSERIALRPNSDYAHPITLKNLLATGRLQLHGEQPGINALSLQIDGSRLAGEIIWAAKSAPFSAVVTILDSNLPVHTIKQWLPDRQQSMQKLRQHLKDPGSVHIEKARLSLLGERETALSWQIETLKGELLTIGWVMKNGPDAELVSLPFDITGDTWQIVNGTGKLGSLQLALAGSGEFNGGNPVLSTLDMSGRVEIEAFLEDWQIRQELLQTSGEIGVRGHLEGPLDQLTMDLQADLSQLNIRHVSGLEFSPGTTDQLDLHSTITPHKISLDHGSIKWSALKGHVSGNYLPGDPDSLAFDAIMTLDELASVTDTLPLLKKLRLRGQADLSISQRGRLQDNRPEMTLTLREVGLHATRFIADLSHINGRVRLTETGMVAKNLQVHIGRSPLTVQAEIPDFSRPSLLLDAKANAIHADDLVFKSENALLRDVDGHLEIDRDGLTFAPVDVRLDGGTNASVQGTISFHPPFDVKLDITSDFAMVREIVGLWTDQPGRAKVSHEVETKGSRTTKDTRAAKSTVTIKAFVKSGNLYGMSFHDATATIIPSRERLTIHPLHFSVGEGSCNAQVLVNFPEQEPVQLRISGHAEDVDALEVYRELLNQKSILRGKLRGDFHLTGNTGKEYIPTTNGQFSIQIREGVLHKFQLLSKVFSLLNVSQIFALQLPDMDQEGMPFDTLTADLQLNQGILSTDNLLIKSRAMNQSYQGQMNLNTREIDLAIGMQPLGTVDKIVSRIPVAGWLLTGEDQSLLSAHFTATGPTDDVTVNLMPLNTITEPTIGLLRRTLGLPFKLLESPEILWGGKGEQATDTGD